MYEILEPKDIAEILKCDLDTVYKLIKQGQLKAKNLGTEKKRIYKIKKEWFDEYLEN